MSENLSNKRALDLAGGNYPTGCVPRCPFHPKYTAKQKPRVNCSPCWELYNWRNRNYKVISDAELEGAYMSGLL